MLPHYERPGCPPPSLLENSSLEICGVALDTLQVDDVFYKRQHGTYKEAEKEAYATLRKEVTGVWEQGSHKYSYHEFLAWQAYTQGVILPAHVHINLKTAHHHRVVCDIIHWVKGDPIDGQHTHAIGMLERVVATLEGKGEAPKSSSAPPTEKKRDLSGNWRSGSNAPSGARASPILPASSATSWRSTRDLSGPWRRSTTSSLPVTSAAVDESTGKYDVPELRRRSWPEAKVSRRP